jgi:hypothetical protein
MVFEFVYRHFMPGGNQGAVDRLEEVPEKLAKSRSIIVRQARSTDGVTTA